MPKGGAATVGDALRAVAGALSPVLVSPAASERLVEAGDLIPLSEGGGIECRLGDPDAADLAVRYIASEAAADHLLNKPLAVARDAGAIIAGLARHWRVKGAPGARFLWLELDLRAGGCPIASVFAGPGNPPQGLPTGLPDDSEWKAIINLLHPGQSARALAHLRAALRPEAWVGYVGIMRGCELRATVSGLTADAVPDFLRALAWPGEMRALEQVLAVVSANGPRITLGLDLTEGIGPALGVELGPAIGDGWEPLLQDAALLAPISETARAALLHWPGFSIADTSWPARLLKRAGGIVRRLNHLKFSIDGANPLRLKAYLYFGLLN